MNSVCVDGWTAERAIIASNRGGCRVFPEGGTNSQGEPTYHFAKFMPKMKMKEFGLGARPLDPPLRNAHLISRLLSM